MSVAINFKICDNSPDCLGIPACPTGAIYFDKEKKTLVIDNFKCINCKKCVVACEVNAIYFAKDLNELKVVQKEIDDDPRKQSDLLVDRYGAEPQAKEFFCSNEKFDIQILQSTKLTVVECFDEDSIHCLIQSIPIKELFEGKDFVYRKFAVEENSFKEKYLIKELPCLLFFNEGKFIGQIDGFYSIEEKQKLIDKLIKIK
ncbi:MAG: 4Fe-4S dicluster domain-containing protein [archaeon]|jgi:ferredoxin